MVRRIRYLGAAICVLVGLLASDLSAQELSGLTPSFGNGSLSVVGEGFKAGEHITLTIRVGTRWWQRSQQADTRGHFAVATGIAVPPGTGVEIDAQGDQGTHFAAITARPAELPRTGAASFPAVVLTMLAVGILSLGIVLRRRVGAR